MWAVPILLGLGCIATVGAASFSKDRANFAMAVTLCLVWIGANILWFHDRMEWMPFLDWITGVWALFIWLHRLPAPPRWSVMVVVISYLRLAMHTFDQLSSHTWFVPYVWGLNGLFAWLLVEVAKPGGRNGAVRIRDLWRRLHLRRASRAALRAPLA